MAVLINKQTGLAEEVSSQDARRLANESHELPLLNREGEVVSSSLEEAPGLLKLGYKHASQEHIDQLLHKARYGTAEQELKTAAEGAAKAATFGLSTGIEKALGVHEEEIKGREEVNPRAHMAGEVAGTLGSALLPGGQLRALEQVGARAATRLGLSGEGMLAQAGARAVRDALAGSAQAAGDEVHKMFLNDPHQTIGTAIAHAGLTGLMSGAVGSAGSSAVNKLSNMKLDPKLAQALAGVREKVWKMGPEAVGAAIGSATGLGPLMGGVSGRVVKSIAGDLMGDSAQMAMKKFLGQTGELSTQGFRALSNLAKSTLDGDKMMNKAMSAVFRQELSEGVEALADKYLPSAKKREELDMQVRRAEMDPFRLNTDDLATYGAEYAAAATEQMARAAQYLASVRPSTDKLAPLDSHRTPSKPEIAIYEQALDIAQQPLVILDMLKQGSLTMSAMRTMKAVHPELLDVLRQKAMMQIGELESKNKPVPFKIKNGLSMLLGQPLTASAAPQNMISIQSVFASLQPENAQQKPSQRNTEALKKVSQESATPGQARELNKQGRVK